MQIRTSLYYGSPIVDTDVEDVIFYYYVQDKGTVQALNMVNCII